EGAQLAQPIEVAVERLENSVSIEEEDVAPHRRVRGGDARGIDEPTRAQAVDLRPAFGEGADRAGERVSSRVWEMRDRRAHGVVPLRRHLDDRRAERLP